MPSFRVFNITAKTYIVADCPDPLNDLDFMAASAPYGNATIINGKLNDIEIVGGEEMIPIRVIKDIINQNEYAHHSTILNQNYILSEIAAMVGVDDESKLCDKICLDDAEKGSYAPHYPDLKTLSLFKIHNGTIRSAVNGPRFEHCESSKHVEALVKAGKTEELNEYLKEKYLEEKYFSSSALEKALEYKNYNCLKALKNSVHWTECVNSFIFNCPYVLTELNDLEKYLVLDQFYDEAMYLFGGYYDACSCDSQKDILCTICKNRKVNYEYLFSIGHIDYDSWVKAVDGRFKFAIRQIIAHRKYFKEDLSEYAVQKNCSYALKKLRKVGYPIKGEEAKESATEKVAEPSIKEQLNDIRRQIQSLMAKIG